MAGRGRCCERSHARFTDEHLKRLAAIARADQRALFERNPHLAVYEPRMLIIALCQGAALHYLDCLKGKTRTNGVKDLDVYTFYSEVPGVGWPYRRHVVKDFGESEFGHHPDKKTGFVGRHVDLMSRALQVEPDADPVLSVREWLADSHNKTPRLLRQKGVVGLYPARYRRARTGDLGGAIELSRAAIDDMFERGAMFLRGFATTVLVESLLARGTVGDLRDAQAAIDRLAEVPTEPGFVLHELPLLRLRALLARAHRDEDGYRDYRDRYRKMATDLGFEGHMKWAEAMT